ncbi:hypothetical protein TBLA_0A10510 [Henningerozyma blattae CBS 6284]|uniref:Arrestin C-terminal-like domain-containing protein n=1 Tax=Henningerozyma blattae (strain ATCC 34711 / CBS 6284 / DSM 70876 / NBRC 10599 / NRRL Y-10934 / UCD 77-7) TaxID=1071380 RepID=I2GXH7_HENB6|nr:hypothetical protein TBLA_0A10510 [Tetrapisispora blattae CBS 6284]CCH58829.1 hypothetical protein TBLA_0A10510 [Tetrapisispora blattae CBS 6284]
MFIGTKSSKSKGPCLFDIRIKSADHNVILLKGPPHRASSALLTGTVVLSVLEPIQIKSMNLRLHGKVLLNILVSKNKDQPRYNKYEKRVFDHSWDNFNFETYLDNLYDNFKNNNATLDTYNSNNNCGNNNNSLSLDGILPNDDAQRRKRALSTASSNSIGSFLGTSQSNYRTLVRGNYEFPFSVILPGTLPETVEGLPNASVAYTMQATIERSKGYSDLTCKKQFRVVRTMAPDSVELSETVCVENSWPDKVEYSISIPARSIAIGSSTPITIKLVPILKRLRLGPIKVTLIEHVQYRGSFGSVNNEERTVLKMKIRDPLGHMKEILDEENGVKEKLKNEDIDPFQESWEIEALLKLPNDLSICTQDCTILKNIKVRHKLKFVISLVNPDGHLSELRANLPVQLYISPFVALTVKNDNETRNYSNPRSDSLNSRDVNRNTSSSSLGYFPASNSFTNLQNNNISSMTPTFLDPNIDRPDRSELLFARSASNVELAVLSNSTSMPKMADLLAPPNYESHTHDRLCGSKSNLADGDISGISSPNRTSFIQDTTLDTLNSAVPIDFNRLSMLSNTDVQDASIPSTPGIIIEQFKNQSSHDLPNGISELNLSGHIYNSNGIKTRSSRANSAASQPPLSFSPKRRRDEWEINTLSRVPSYDIALTNDEVANDLPPAYPSDESLPGMNSTQLERPQLIHHRSGSFISTSSSRPNLTALNKSNNSSSVSLVDLSRTSTTNNNNSSINHSNDNSNNGFMNSTNNSNNSNSNNTTNNNGFFPVVSMGTTVSLSSAPVPVPLTSLAPPNPGFKGNSHYGMSSNSQQPSDFAEQPNNQMHQYQRSSISAVVNRQRSTSIGSTFKGIFTKK